MNCLTCGRPTSAHKGFKCPAASVFTETFGYVDSPSLIETIARQLADALMAKKEQVVRDAITHSLGSDSWDIWELKGRGQFIIAGGKETFVFDGVPLVEFYPPVFTNSGLTLDGMFNHRLLYT